MTPQQKHSREERCSTCGAQPALLVYTADGLALCWGCYSQAAVVKAESVAVPQ